MAEDPAAIAYGSVPAPIPDAFAPVPIFDDAGAASPRICVLVHDLPDREPNAGMPVVLRDQHDSRVFLGALLDARKRIVRWLEIWVQSPGAIRDVELVFQEGLNNRLLDERWADRADAMSKAPISSPMWTGHEIDHPRPSFIVRAPNNAGWRLRSPTTSDGEPWVLCQDPERLKAAERPAYAEDSHRYLHVAGRPDLGFLDSSEIAPDGRVAPKAAASLSLPDNAVALNPAAGLLMVRPFVPYAYEEFVDILSGITIEGPLSDALRRAWTETNDDAPDAGRMFVGSAARWGRLLEVFHLKLRAFMDAARAVRAMTQRTRVPMLNLDLETFRVAVEPTAGRLPFLWNAQCLLADGGQGILLPIRSSTTPYFVPLKHRPPSIWQPDASGRFQSGQSTLSVESVLPTPTGTVLEGWLTQPQDLELRLNDLINLRFTVSATRCDLFAIVEKKGDDGASQVFLRTIPQRLPDQVTRALGGVRYRVAYRVVPLMSTPFDLHALAVLGVRTLLANEPGKLPAFKNRLEILADKAARLRDPAKPTPLEDRVAAVLSKDAELSSWLGPHRLIAPAPDAPAPAEVLDLVTPELWWMTLAMLIRAFPELSDDSSCEHLGDTDPDALHRVFDTLLADADRILLRTRMFILGEQALNREVADVIRARLKEA